MWKTRTPEGGFFYIIPSAPDKTIGTFYGSKDIVADADAYNSRAPGQLAVNSADTSWVIRQNAYANRKLGGRDWADLHGSECGRTCILVSCGPSLTESIPEIKKLAEDTDNYFTLGINRAFKAFDLDYYVVMDRRAQSDWIDRDVGDVKLIAATTSAHHIVSKFKNIYWGDNFLGGIDEGYAPMRTGLGITLCEAMMIAYKMGADEILLYGCDFAMSGNVQDGQYMLDKYYYDLPSYVGLGIRPDRLREMQPVYGINDRLCFINYELYAYSCYATAMACMIEESGGVPVRNMSKMGIMYWGSDDEHTGSGEVEGVYQEAVGCGPSGLHRTGEDSSRTGGVEATGTGDAEAGSATANTADSSTVGKTISDT